MASLVHLVVEKYEQLEKGTHADVDSWPFMSSPIPILSICAFYLYFVMKLGPALMKNRQPFNLQGLLVAYNAYQVAFSAWICSMPLRTGTLHLLFSFSVCQQPATYDPYRNLILEGIWWYFLSKVVELLDTVFFVLRKKQNQVTFLHLYHHCSMAFFTWTYLKYAPGPQSILIGCLNSFVHVVMYSYYMLAAMGPQFQKYLWWKKYMTWLQLGQFCLMLVYLGVLLAMDCRFPKNVSILFFANITFFLYLFADFYRKSYKKKVM